MENLIFYNAENEKEIFKIDKVDSWEEMENGKIVRKVRMYNYEIDLKNGKKIKMIGSKMEKIGNEIVIERINWFSIVNK